MKKLKLDYKENLNGALLGGGLGGLITSFPIYTTSEGPWYWINTTIWKILIFALVGKYLITLIQFLLGEVKPKIRIRLDITVLAIALGSSGLLRYSLEPVWRVTLVCMSLLIVVILNKDKIKPKKKK